MTVRTTYIQAIGTSVPSHDIHRAFVNWAERQLDEPREKALFTRMAERSGIDHRWSVLERSAGGGSPVDPEGFYAFSPPSTGERMRVYAEAAPLLALDAIGKLNQKVSVEGITHLVVASCTGFVSPGIDQIVAAELGLDPGVERTLIGFMGCYAAVSALRVAHHIVRSESEARVLTVTVELSSLHLQDERQLEPLLAMLQFGDGAAAALVTAEPAGFAMSNFFATTLRESSELIRWTIGDTGFAMHLSGEVPARIGAALGDEAVRNRLLSTDGGEMDCWAIHAGGRSILDAVEKALSLPASSLAASRGVLARYGNMSSSTLMFVLEDLLATPQHRRGTALAFGPGLAAEGFRFERA